MPSKANTSTNTHKKNTNNSKLEVQTFIGDFFNPASRPQKGKSGAKQNAKLKRHSIAALVAEAKLTPLDVKAKRKSEVLEVFMSDSDDDLSPLYEKKARLEAETPRDSRVTGKGKGRMVADLTDDAEDWTTPAGPSRIREPPTSATMVSHSTLRPSRRAAHSEIVRPRESPPSLGLRLYDIRSSPRTEGLSESETDSHWKHLPSSRAIFSKVVDDDDIVPCSQSIPSSSQASPNRHVPLIPILSDDQASPETINHTYYRASSEFEIIPDSQGSSPEKPSSKKQLSPLLSASSPTRRIRNDTIIWSQYQRRSFTRIEHSDDIVPSSRTCSLLTMPSFLQQQDINMDLIVPSSQSQLLSPPPKDYHPPSQTYSPLPPLPLDPTSPRSPSRHPRFLYESPEKMSKTTHPNTQPSPSKNSSTSFAIPSSPSKAPVFFSPTKRKTSGSLPSDSQTQEESYAPWMKEFLAREEAANRSDDPDITIAPPHTQESSAFSETQEESYAPWFKQHLVKKQQRTEHGSNNRIQKSDVLNASTSSGSKGSLISTGSPKSHGKVFSHKFSFGSQGPIRRAPPNTDEDPDMTVVVDRQVRPMLPPSLPSRLSDKLVPPLDGSPKRSYAFTDSLRPLLSGEESQIEKGKCGLVFDGDSQFSMLSEGPDFEPLGEEFFQGLALDGFQS